MRPTRDLRGLQRNALARIGRVRAHIERALDSGAGNGDGAWASGLDPGIAVGVMELDNLWASVARSLYLSTAFCARDGGGQPLTLAVPQCRTTGEALGHAIKRCKGDVFLAKEGVGPWEVGDEPAWGRANHLLASLDAIGASNYDKVSAALSLAPKVFPYMHTCRNFYAHRSMEAKRQVEGVVRSYGLPTRCAPTEALVSPAVASGGLRPQPLILDWADELRETIELLV